MHAIVARSTFPSQNVQSTPASDHFWKLSCRKSARHCGAKHISKSKCTKHTSSGPLWKLSCRKSARRCGAKHIFKSKCRKHRELFIYIYIYIYLFIYLYIHIHIHLKSKIIIIYCWYIEYIHAHHQSFGAPNSG